jgi:hypothetical protein
VKSHAPAVHEGTAFGPPTPVQSTQREPHAVTVVTGMQLPPHSVVLGGQAQRLRDRSHSWPPPQLLLPWQPNVQRLVRVSQK